MIEVTTEEFKNFIFLQDDNQPIDMSESTTDCFCGCLMAQYAKERFPNTDIACGYSQFFNKGLIFAYFPDVAMRNYLRQCDINDITTFGEAKAIWNGFFE